MVAVRLTFLFISLGWPLNPSCYQNPKQAWVIDRLP
jgi:hypothetical protein